MQRGFWANGVDDLRGLVEETRKFTLRERVDRITCPTLLTLAENDPLAAAVEDFFAALSSPKQLERFTAAEGAGEHCEMMNRSLLNRRVLDWLDDVFAAP